MSHWYDAQGNACHYITGKNGKERATTLRDARACNLFPSVTTVLDIAAKPALTNWLVEQAFLAALTLPKGDDESLDDFMKRAKADARQQAKDSADVGTEIHNDIERLFKGLEPLKHTEAANATFELVKNLTGLSKGWVAEQTFSCVLGFGGMVDLHHPDGEVVIDYKTKDFGPDDLGKVFAYDEHAMQLSAYAHGLGMPWARKINIFVSRTHPGLVIHHEWDGDYFNRFELLLRYWQLAKNYTPEAA
jgi:hypothetical protein